MTACLNDYFTWVDSQLHIPNKYLDVLTNNYNDLNDELYNGLNTYKNQINTTLIAISGLSTSLSTFLDGINCNFVKNTANRFIISLCGQFVNAIGGITVVMMGAAICNLLGLCSIIYFNLYLHNRKVDKAKVERANKDSA